MENKVVYIRKRDIYYKDNENTKMSIGVGIRFLLFHDYKVLHIKLALLHN
jgi:hypothetical protein